MTEKYIDAFLQSFNNSFSWIVRSICFDVSWTENYFWGLILISIFVLLLEILWPWRKYQLLMRKEFFLDIFYMFFNFFIFTVMISGFYKIAEIFLNSLDVSLKSLSLFNILPTHSYIQILVFFVVLDYLQWLTHLCLHRFKVLWRFHKVHHSVKEMSFAAHLRYHWMENIFYKPAKILGLVIIGGFEPRSAYIVHFSTLLIGHLNHANIKLSYGPLKYIFNNPVMHLHHHAYDIPRGSFGKNFGISLSLWDYLFKTAYVPNDDGNTKLGFKGDEKFPTRFTSQCLWGFFKT